MSGTVPVELTLPEITALRLVAQEVGSGYHPARFLTAQDRDALRSAYAKLNEASCRAEGS